MTNKAWQRILGAVVFLGIVLSFVTGTLSLGYLPDRTFDAFQKWKPRQSDEQDPVVVVGIDEASLDAIGQWPWPRSYLARLTDQLHGMGARAIAFDIVFPEPDRMGVEHDLQFAQAIEKAPVVLGMLIDGSSSAETNGKFVFPERMLLQGTEGPANLPWVPRVVPSFPFLPEGPRTQGHLYTAPELDGVARRVRAAFSWNGNLIPALALETLRVYRGQKTMLSEYREDFLVSIAIDGDLRLPVSEGQGIIPYYSRWKPENVVSAVDVLEGKIEPSAVRNRIVLVGATAQGLQDWVFTPLGQWMPGVGIHAEVIRGALQRSLLQRPSFNAAAEVTLALFLGLATIFLLPHVPGRWLVLQPTLTIGASFTLAWALFAGSRILFDPWLAVLVSFAVFLAMVLVRLTGHAA